MLASAALAFALALPLGAAPAPAPAAAGRWTGPIELRGAVDGAPATGRLWTYLPRGYAPEGAAPRPLVLALHGWDHSPESFRRQARLAEWADRLGAVVGAPELGRSVYESARYPESRGGPAAPGARWVGEVVLPYLRAHYAVSPGRARTAVLGYSTGGRGALLLAAAYPEFAFAASLSGTYDLDLLQPSEGEYRIHARIYGPRERFPERWRRDHLLAPERLARLAGTRLWAAHGGRDRVVRPDQLEALRAALAAGGLEAELVLAPEAGHDWAFWSAQWDQLFEALGRALAGDAEKAP